MSDAPPVNGLSAAEAAQRLRKLGTPELASSRSTASIIAGNVFTLFNAIIGVFFIMTLVQNFFDSPMDLLLIFDNSFIKVALILGIYLSLRQNAVGRKVSEKTIQKTSSISPATMMP